MNVLAQQKIDEMKAAMAAHPGEGEEDRRAVTSPVNGAKGGRPPIDNTAVAEQYEKQFNTKIRWWRGVFYEYDATAGFWRVRTKEEMGARVAAFLNQRPVIGGAIPLSYTKNLEGNVVGSLRGTKDLDLAPPCFLDNPDKDARAWAAMSNGLLDIEAAARGEAGALRPNFTPNFFSTRHFPFKWNPSADCPRFKQFLAEIQPDEKNRKMLLKLAGLLLIPDTSYNVFFILLGDGGCGKSTFLRILTALLGEDNTCTVTLSEMAEKHTAYRLTRTLANLVDDSATADGSKFGQSMGTCEGLLKRVTSGANVHCEPKGVDPWEAPATARCVFCVNPPMPQFVDRSSALWDRLRIVPFTQRFRGTEKQDSHLADEIIATELPGIFALAVSSLGDLLQEKTFPQSEAGQVIIAAHREMCDKEKRFLLDLYEPREGAYTPSHDVYGKYSTWCKERGYNPKNAGNFAAEVRRVFPLVVGPKKTRENGEQKWRYYNLDRIVEPLPINPWRNP